MFGSLLMAAMHGLLDYGSAKNAIETFGFSVPLAALKKIVDFGGRLETTCSGICVLSKGLDGGVTSTCIRGVGCDLTCFWR